MSEGFFDDVIVEGFTPAKYVPQDSNTIRHENV